MKLEISIDGDRDDILTQMTKIWGMIMEESQHEGVAKDVNGNTIGRWIAVDWDSKDHIRDYAQFHSIALDWADIKGTSETGLTISGMDAKEWFAAMLAD